MAFVPSNVTFDELILPGERSYLPKYTGLGFITDGFGVILLVSWTPSDRGSLEGTSMSGACFIEIVATRRSSFDLWLLSSQEVSSIVHGRMRRHVFGG